MDIIALERTWWLLKSWANSQLKALESHKRQANSPFKYLESQEENVNLDGARMLNDSNKGHEHLKCPLTPVGHDLLQVGDKVNILDLYDGAISGIGGIKSLSVIHGVPLGLEDSNVNFINVTSNIPLLYEDKIDGRFRLKEKEKSFT